MLNKHRALLVAGIVSLLAVAVLVVNFSQLSGNTDATEQVVGRANSTSDDESLPGTETSTNPAETKSNVPVGAVQVDEYAYVLDGEVYIRSTTDGEPLNLPKSDADTFRVVSQPSFFSSEKVSNDCGGPGWYHFYSDKNKVYFHQTWNTPTFRSNKIEVLKGVVPEDFKIKTTDLFTDGENSFSINHYITETETCFLEIREN